ncbi:MAG: nucleoside monophosphate kinase, partial [Planctomycetota bacterium]|nr:nucleoside monophosphate kinase [Planctomycetota bacterium]
ELEYQSSLELEARTHDRLRCLPLAREITIHARQELVRRLDSYELEQTELFEKVVKMINEKFIDIIQRHALSGKAIVNSEDPLFADPATLPILIDVFSERGYHAVVDKTITEIPDRFDVKSGKIETRKKTIYRFEITFKGSDIRRG